MRDRSTRSSSTQPTQAEYGFGGPYFWWRQGGTGIFGVVALLLLVTGSRGCGPVASSSPGCWVGRGRGCRCSAVIDQAENGALVANLSV